VVSTILFNFLIYLLLFYIIIIIKKKKLVNVKQCYRDMLISFFYSIWERENGEL
jgi:hypothetical protein